VLSGFVLLRLRLQRGDDFDCTLSLDLPDVASLPRFDILDSTLALGPASVCLALRDLDESVSRRFLDDTVLPFGVCSRASLSLRAFWYGELVITSAASALRFLFPVSVVFICGNGLTSVTHTRCAPVLPLVDVEAVSFRACPSLCPPEMGNSVTVDGAKSSSPNFSGLYGHILDAAKPFTALSTLATL